MCGRFTLKMPWNDVLALYRAFLDGGKANSDAKTWAGKINIAPTTDIPVVYLGKTEGSSARTLALMRWGLIPSWSKEIGKFSTFNARAEGIESKPAYRGEWKAGRRCLIPADSFFEWRKTDKQPFAIGLGNKGPMALAGLWGVWSPQGQPPVFSCTIITTEANPLIKDIHPRMPVILDEDQWPVWLGEESAQPNNLKALLGPFPAERMSAWPVSKDVGNVRNQGENLLKDVSSRAK